MTTTPKRESEAAASALDLWLWPEGDGIRWWCPEDTRLLMLDTPGRMDDRSTLRALFDGRAELALSAALAPELADPLSDLLSRRTRVRLHLHAALPAPWHDLAFEWLRERGHTLHERLSVVRYWEDEPIPIAPVPRERPTVLLNLMPQSDRIQPARGLAGGLAQVMDGREMTEHFLARSDLTSLGALCVVAHGTRDASGAPFLLPDNRPWSLPIDRGLPPLLVLLACGNHDGNLIQEGRRLLDAGARTVIAPLGNPTAERARDLLRDFLAQWQAGERVDEILWTLAAEPEGEARRLLVLGRGELRSDDRPCPEEQRDEQLATNAQDGDSAALHVLLERVTRRCTLAGQDIDEAEAEIRRLFGVGLVDRDGERRLLEHLGKVQSSLSPLARAWVLPLLAALAAAYAHDRMEEFEAGRAELERRGVPVTAPILQAWSKTYYRSGHYGLALADLARGLTLLGRDDPCRRGAELLGQLVALMIDLHLPYEAKRLEIDLEHCLSHRRDEDAKRDRFFLSDRMARIELRLGNPRSALSIYRRKRADAPRFGQNGGRELAWLLYVSGWLTPETPDEAAEWDGWARAAEAMVTTDFADQARFGGGNADFYYLLRALALRAWRHRDRNAADLVLTHRGILQERLHAGTAGDPGPPGLCFAFLHLAKRDALITEPPIPSWDEIRPPLELHRYFIELAALSYLLGRRSEAADYLDRFHAQRSLPPSVSFPNWLHEGLLADWPAVCESRVAHERTILYSHDKPDPGRLVVSGLLPL